MRALLEEARRRAALTVGRRASSSTATACSTPPSCATAFPHPPAASTSSCPPGRRRRRAPPARRRASSSSCVTNQPDIARGTQTREAVQRINDALLVELPLDEVVVCPHDDADGCACRKPKPGMLLDAAERVGIDLDASFMVGDRWRDVEAGRSARAAGPSSSIAATMSAPSEPDARHRRSGRSRSLDP